MLYQSETEFHNRVHAMVRTFSKIQHVKILLKSYISLMVSTIEYTYPVIAQNNTFTHLPTQKYLFFDHPLKASAG